MIPQLQINLKKLQRLTKFNLIHQKEMLMTNLVIKELTLQGLAAQLVKVLMTSLETSLETSLGEGTHLVGDKDPIRALTCNTR